MIYTCGGRTLKPSCEAEGSCKISNSDRITAFYALCILRLGYLHHDTTDFNIKSANYWYMPWAPIIFRAGLCFSIIP